MAFFEKMRNPLESANNIEGREVWLMMLHCLPGNIVTFKSNDSEEEGRLRNDGKAIQENGMWLELTNTHRFLHSIISSSSSSYHVNSAQKESFFCFSVSITTFGKEMNDLLKMFWLLTICPLFFCWINLISHIVRKDDDRVVKRASHQSTHTWHCGPYRFIRSVEFVIDVKLDEIWADANNGQCSAYDDGMIYSLGLEFEWAREPRWSGFNYIRKSSLFLFVPLESR